MSACGPSAEGDPETASVLSEGGVTHGQLLSVPGGHGRCRWQSGASGLLAEIALSPNFKIRKLKPERE